MLSACEASQKAVIQCNPHSFSSTTPKLLESKKFITLGEKLYSEGIYFQLLRYFSIKSSPSFSSSYTLGIWNHKEYGMWFWLSRTCNNLQVSTSLHPMDSEHVINRLSSINPRYCPALFFSVKVFHCLKDIFPLQLPSTELWFSKIHSWSSLGPCSKSVSLPW